MRTIALGVSVCLAVGLAHPGTAGEMVTAEQAGDTTLSFVLSGTHSHATLSVSGPNGFHATTSSLGGAVALDLAQFGKFPDGTYQYQLTAASNEIVGVNNNVDNGRGPGARNFAYKPSAKSGYFNVRGGKIVDHGVPAQRGRRDRDAR